MRRVIVIVNIEKAHLRVGLFFRKNVSNKLSINFAVYFVLIPA